MSRHSLLYIAITDHDGSDSEQKGTLRWPVVGLMVLIMLSSSQLYNWAVARKREAGTTIQEPMKLSRCCSATDINASNISLDTDWTSRRLKGPTRTRGHSLEVAQQTLHHLPYHSSGYSRRGICSSTAVCMSITKAAPLYLHLRQGIECIGYAVSMLRGVGQLGEVDPQVGEST